jgi:hypothetical protein
VGESILCACVNYIGSVNFVSKSRFCVVEVSSLCGCAGYMCVAAGVPSQHHDHAP